MTKILDLFWFRNNFENIRVDMNRIKYLEELQIAFSTLSNIDLIQIVPNLQLGIIFDCLNTSDTLQLELAVAVMKKLLPVLNPAYVIRLYGIHLGRALEHPYVEAKKLVLNELNRASESIELLTIICKEIPLLVSVIECVKSDDLSLASTASQFLNELGKIRSGMDVLFSLPLLEYFSQAAAENDSVRFRIYDIVINISIHSVEGLNVSVNSKLLLNLIDELQSTDILLQLTSLETIAKLAVTDHGFQFFKEKGLFEYLEQQLNNHSTFAPLLLPGLIKFFGNIAQTRPEVIFSDYPNVINLIFQLCDSDDHVISNICLETIGYIASNPKGKEILNNYELQMQNVMQIIGKIITLKSTEEKITALNVLSNILRLNVAYLLVENFLNITKTWFLQVSDNPIKIIMNICERPFMELKLAGLVALKTIAEQFWGQEEINKCSGLIEYLLDRHEESDMNCKTLKYEIVKTIVESPSSSKIFSRDLISKFQLHVRQGIVYFQAKTEIAFENAT